MTKDVEGEKVVPVGKGDAGQQVPLKQAIEFRRDLGKGLWYIEHNR